jgi:integrase
MASSSTVLIERDPYILLFGCYAPSTRAAYIKAVNHFVQWCGSNGYVPSSVYTLDYYLAKYLVHLYYMGGGRTEATHALYGLDMLLPGLRHDLVWSLRSVRGFGRLRPSSPWAPLPFTVAAAIAAWLAVNHNRWGFAMAVGVLLSFDCYLRSSELLDIHYEDVAYGRDARLGLDDKHEDRVHIHLRQTKTGKNKGVEVRDPHIRLLLCELRRRCHYGDRLFEWSRETHLKWFHKACKGLLLTDHYVHHSLRHGGATRDYLNGMPIADVMVRGRWAAHKSAVHYIQSGRQLMMLQSIPPWLDDVGRYLVKDNLSSLIYSLALSQSTK